MSARVVIAGAGIGGLTAAVALRRAGHEVVLLERMPELAEIGGGITLAPNAKIALRHLGLAEAVEAAGAPLEHFEHRKRDGETIANWPLLAVAEMVGEGGTGLPRPELQRILHGAVDGAELRLGAEVTAAEEDGGMAIARLAGGEEVRGDVLVGADGVHSTIRPRFDPTPLRYAGYTAWRGMARLGDAADSLVRPGVQVQTYGRGSAFGTIPIGHGLVYWFAARNAPAGGEDEPGRRKEALLELFAGWHEPIARLIEASYEEAITRTDVYDLPRRERWGSGRVTLLGDAAHPTTPTLGQGACMAIEDGVVLARQLGSHDDPVAALRAFEAERIPRTARIVKQSRMRGRMVLSSGRLSTSIRDRVLASLPQRATLRALSGVFRFEP